MMACTGDTTEDVTRFTEPAIIQNENDFMVISIGGNDFGFAGIAFACLSPYPTHGEGTCEEARTKVKDIIESDDFETKITGMYDKLIAKMEPHHQYQINQISYPKFFAAQTS